MATLALPDAQKLLTELLGVDVTVRAGGLPPDSGVAALYVDAQGTYAAGAWFDRSLAAYAGASLAMIPQEPAEEAQASEALPDNLFENVTEVLNVFAKILSPGRHVKLDRTVRTPPAPTELGDLLAEACDATWFTVEVTGYGSGVALVVQPHTLRTRW